MHRRDFVGGLIGSSVALLVTPSLCVAATEALTASIPIRNVPPALDVYSLGGEYLKVRPQLRERSILIKEILDGSNALSDESRLATHLARSIANDFDRDVTLRIDGWVFAETELKLCALHAMTVAET